MITEIREKWREFCQWQQRPYRLAPMSEEHHRCFTCGQEYQGNFCPHCGQSARIGRYSLKNALLLFLDVWGVGNRGMFRTLRDLLLRPGYMIRDYISGMQMAYFPPFKLLFLLVAFSLIVNSGVNVRGRNYEKEHTERLAKKYAPAPDAPKVTTRKMTTSERVDEAMNDIQRGLHRFMTEREAVFWLLVLTVLTGPLYVFFRRSPAIPDMRFSELLVAMVYSLDMIYACQLVTSFFTIGNFLYMGYVSLLLPVVALKQLSGFAWWKTAILVALSYFGVLVVVFVMICVALVIELIKRGVI